LRELLRLLAVVNGRRREDVSLSAIARLAHRSPFHLHRRFVALTGETPKAYTSRVRLDRAAADLLATDRPVAVIAAGHGFASHEAFTRAFTRRFGVSPRTYRARGLTCDLAAAGHAATVTSVAPCVGLYRMPTDRPTERTEAMPADLPADLPADVAVKVLPATHALVMRKRVTRDEIAATLGSMLPAVFAHTQRHGVALAGPPFARYPEIGMGSMVIEAGFAVTTPADGDPEAGIEALTVPAGEAAVAIHRGPYDGLPATFETVEAWVRAEGRSPSGPPMEIYLTDPGEHPDPATWETQVVLPVT
jgi:AraC family transcriptional regulator